MPDQASGLELGRALQVPIFVAFEGPLLNHRAFYYRGRVAQEVQESASVDRITEVERESADITRRIVKPPIHFVTGMIGKVGRGHALLGAAPEDRFSVLLIYGAPALGQESSQSQTTYL